MSYFGKEFKLESQDNFEEFLDALNVTGDKRSALLNNKSTTKLVKNGDSYTLYSSQPGNTNSEVTFKNGVEFDEKVRDGLISKTKVTVGGDTYTTVQKYPDGTEITYKREFSGNQLITTISKSGWSGSARRVYKA